MNALKCSVAICISLACIAGLFSCSVYKPDRKEILIVPRWDPFIQECRRFDYARSSYDDGGMVFVMYPGTDDAEDYFDSVTADAIDAGWDERELSESIWKDSSRWLRDRRDGLLNKFMSENVVCKYFSRRLHSEHPFDKTVELLELTYFENDGVVLFVSGYAVRWQFPEDD